MISELQGHEQHLSEPENFFEIDHSILLEYYFNFCQKISQNQKIIVIIFYSIVTKH